MEVSVKDIKGFKVYDHEAKEPWGIVTDICFDCNSAKVTAVIAETISIIPITKVIDFDKVNNIIKGAIVLKKGTVPQNRDQYGQNNGRMMHFNKVEKVIDKNLVKNRLRDIRFDFETGEMTDIVFSKNFFAKKNKIGVNKIDVKDNTIYIDKNEGGNSNV